MARPPRLPRTPARERRVRQTMFSGANAEFWLEHYTDGTRPGAGNPGRIIWNVTDTEPQYDDGTDWQGFKTRFTPKTVLPINADPFIYIAYELSGLSVTNGIDRPQLKGQVVTICLNKRTAAQTLTIDGTINTPNTEFREGGSDFTVLTFSTPGDVVVLQGYEENDVLKWHVVSRNGPTIS